MERRKYLKSATGIAISVVGFAGCSALGGLEVESVNAQTTTFGNVKLQVVVANNSSDTESGTLVGQVDIKGGDTYTEQQSVTVPGNAANSYTLSFNIGLGDSLTADSFEYSAQIE